MPETSGKNHRIPTIRKEQEINYCEALPSHLMLEASMRDLFVYLLIYLFDAHSFKFCALSDILLVFIRGTISNFDPG
jgi:hypothetical protein